MHFCVISKFWRNCASPSDVDWITLKKTLQIFLSAQSLSSRSLHCLFKNPVLVSLAGVLMMPHCSRHSRYPNHPVVRRCCPLSANLVRWTSNVALTQAGSLARTWKRTLKPWNHVGQAFFKENRLSLKLKLMLKKTQVDRIHNELQYLLKLIVHTMCVSKSVENYQADPQGCSHV